MKSTKSLDKKNNIYIYALCVMLCAGKIFAQNPLYQPPHNTNLGTDTTKQVDFKPDKTSGCVPLNVTFKNLTKNGGSWFWDFGNGTTSTQCNPSVVYLSPGNYTVKLFCSKSNGAQYSLVLQDLIRVKTLPVAGFYAAKISSCVNDNNFLFVNTSVNSDKWIWDFGDGSFSTLRDPQHTYVTPGKYTVKLVADNGFNCKDVMVKTDYIEIYPKPDAGFTSNTTTSCNPATIFSFSPSDSSAIEWK
ncbi:MAG: PKD domain-containing protein [Bacteroidetes bacterium]|nr:PKD domain-containing protein [Bacteroidota bacterium]